jgi:dihydrodipicolinate synthase/N-acetylneuraminate lyase
MTPVRGVLAAAVTPLRNGGMKIDGDAIGALYTFYAATGLDGVLALGTTGEGILLDTAERKLVTRLALDASEIPVLIHVGAQTTAESVSMAAYAAEVGAAGVAAIGPPYFPFDEAELLGHFLAIAAACAPVPFYVYEFAARSGYAVPVSVIATLRDKATNLVGLKVSDQPWAQFAPYLLDGLDVFVGPEPLIVEGVQAGAAGAVSGLAGGLPEAVVDVAARGWDVEACARAATLRRLINDYPFQAALKSILAWRGVPVRQEVRAPLRSLDSREAAELRHRLAAFDERYDFDADAAIAG